MITVVITSYNEEQTIGRCIQALYDACISFGDEFEILQVSPDSATISAGKNQAAELEDLSFRTIKDPRKGKAVAINLALDRAKGDTIILTDGDTYVSRTAIRELLKPLADENFGVVCGRPIPTNHKSKFWGFAAHFFTFAADTKRKEVFKYSSEGYRYKDDAFFPLSGYLIAFRASMGLRYDPGYIDDAFIPFQALEQGFQIAYTPRAEVFVRFPNNMTDYFIQRERNLNGTNQVYTKLNVQNQRRFRDELAYALLPLQFAKRPKEYLYATLLYPLRLLTWIYVFYTKTFKKTSYGVWREVRSTKS